jgi:hypothetical protein
VESPTITPIAIAKEKINIIKPLFHCFNVNLSEKDEMN